MTPTFVLASGSPRRREMLAAMGLPFIVAPSDVVEGARPGEEVRAYVERLAREKAASVAARHPQSWVIAADTVVYLEDTILEKPASVGEAEAMLARIAGRSHVVFTGVALQNLERGEVRVTVEESKVTMSALTPEEIRWYVATGEPMDKAGSYAIQGIGAMFVEAVDGNYTNVVGLPMPALFRMMKAAGIDILGSLRV